MRFRHSQWLRSGLVIVALAGIASKSHAQREEAAPGYPWYEVNAKKEVTIRLYLFWSSSCPHCPPAVEFARDLEKRLPWAKVIMYEISAHEGNRALYWQMAANLGKPVGPTPAFVYCRHMNNGYLSYDLTGKHIEADMKKWHDFLTKHYQKPAPKPEEKSKDAPPQKGQAFWSDPRLVFFALAQPPEPEPGLPPDFPLDLPPAGETISAPVWGDVDVQSLSLPAFTVVLAACDAFNPCAFFVLLLLLSLMVHHHSRARMLFIGGVFVLASGVMYFLFMAAWLNLFFLFGHLRVITLAAGALAVVAAAINIKDFFWFKHGPSLSIPESAKPGLFRRMNHLLVTSGPIPLITGTIALAFAANLYELLCTSGFPMIYTRVLTLRELSPMQYYLYLAAYNLIYVLPMAAIVLGFVLTLGSYKLSEYQGRVLKLLSGLMMLGLGVILLVRPEWLTSAGSAAALLVAAVIATWLIARWDRRRWRLSPVGQTSVTPVSTADVAPSGREAPRVPTP